MKNLKEQFKRILEEKQLLKEYLSSEFMLGFELEAFSGDFTEEVPNELLQEMEKMFTGITKHGEVTLDPSISPDLPFEQKSFEIISPVFPFSIKNLKSLRTLLDSLFQRRIFTNNSCGFHSHLSWKYISPPEMMWAMLGLVRDKEFLQEVLEPSANLIFHELCNASTLKLDILKEAFRENDKESFLEVVEKVYDSDKFFVFRLHPQNTLEWRGPRGFLDRGDIQDIKDYLVILYKLVIKLNKYIMSDAIVNEEKGYSISKGYFMKLFKNVSEHSWKKRFKSLPLAKVEKVLDFFENTQVPLRRRVQIMHKMEDSNYIMELRSGEELARVFSYARTDGYLETIVLKNEELPQEVVDRITPRLYYFAIKKMLEKGNIPSYGAVCKILPTRERVIKYLLMSPAVSRGSKECLEKKSRDFGHVSARR